MLQTLLALPRTVWLIGFISLVNDSASEMLYPLLPLYISSVLMAGPRALGLIEGIAEATSSLLRLVSGVLVDRTHRSKPWILLGYALAGFGRPLIAFVSAWPWLLLIRFADRVGKGLRSAPRDALLAQNAGPDNRGLVFGLHRAMDNAGAVIGPLVAAFLLARHVPMQQIFLWSIVPALLCLGLSASLRDAPVDRANPVTGNAAPADGDGARWGWRDMPPRFKRYLIAVALFTLGNASNMFLLLRAHELGVPQADVPLLWAAVSAVATVFATPLSALSDRLGRRRLLLAGYVAYGLVYLCIGLMAPDGGSHPVALVTLFASYGLFLAATEGVEKALVADLAPPDRRGTAYGWFHLVTGLFLLPASVIFGWLYQLVSPAAAFGFSSACALGAAVLLAGWVGLRERSTDVSDCKHAAKGG